ncbi:anti-sigma factor family protein [Catenulispora rubra]|uniref:anti-sigma factor family protein n=1 Tax=Catenulispora rubra TaxID=280293 RepID=UPI001891F87E|nr:zf-HC2 domain-containing protein [Catenulispora rubra]
MTDSVTEPEHTDIGAYVLGLMEPDEAERFEEHLFGCDRCTAELDDLADLPALLRPLVRTGDEADAAGADGPGSDGSATEGVGGAGSTADASRAEPLTVARPSADLLPRVLEGVKAQRAYNRRRNLLALAAAVVLIIAGPVVGVAIGHNSSTTPKPTDSVAAELVMMGERHTAADPATGVSAVVGMEQREWGTHIAIELSGLHGPLTCDLVAVAKDGTTQVVTNWLVPDHGYGVPGHTAPLDMHGGTAIAKANLTRVEVRTTDTNKVLLSVPV